MKKLNKLTILIVTLALLGGGLLTWNYLSSQAVKPVVAQIKHVETNNPPTVAELLKLVNEERAKVGVKALAINDNVQKSAQLKADDMFNRNYFSHIVKGTDKVLTPEMDKLLSETCLKSSENIRDNDNRINTSLEAFNAWKNSAPHYKAMTNPDYTLTGFGVSGDKIVEHFCVAK